MADSGRIFQIDKIVVIVVTFYKIPELKLRLILCHICLFKHIVMVIVSSVWNV
jgi:hypothetical protein